MASKAAAGTASSWWHQLDAAEPRRKRGRPWWVDSIHFFVERGYDVIMGNAPYTHRGPGKKGKVRLYSPSEVPQVFYAVAIPVERHEHHPSEVPARFEVRRGSLDFIVTPLT